MSSIYISVERVGNYILTREKTPGDKNAKCYRIKYGPTLYIPDNNQKSKFRSLMTGAPLKPVEFESITDARNFINRYKKVHGIDIHGMDNWPVQFISDQWPDSITKIPDIRVGLFDMETTANNGFPNVLDPTDEITALTIHIDGHYYAFGHHGDFVIPDRWKGKVTYFRCTDEAALIKSFISIVVDKSVDVLAGWNSEKFDIPYFVMRARRVIGEKALNVISPFKIVRDVTFKDERGQDQLTHQIYGLPHVDYQQIYMKYSGKTQESYALDNISKVELNKGKLDFSEWGTIQDIHIKNHQIFIEYNIEDVMRLVEIDEKRKLFSLAFNLAYTAKVNFSDVLRQTRMWDSLIYSNAYRDGEIIPLRKSTEGKDEKYRGAYVMDPIPGAYDWVLSYDLNSLYPNLMIQYNISPETILDGKIDVNINDAINGRLDFSNEPFTVAANGARFTKEKQGLIPKILLGLMKEREYFKGLQLKIEAELNDLDNQLKKTPDDKALKDLIKAKKVEHIQYKNLQETKKVCLNSAYGALGTAGFRFYSVDLAEAITISGQLTIQWITRTLTETLNDEFQDTGNYVVAGDTDSIYVNLKRFVDLHCSYTDTEIQIAEKLDHFSKTVIEPHLAKSYAELGNMMSVYTQRMKMKREAIIQRAVWHMKKHYIMAIRNGEGGIMYQTPVIKMKGISAVKSSTPALIRTELKKAMEIILLGTRDQMMDHIKQFKDRFFKMSFLEIAAPRKVSDVDKYSSTQSIYTKGTPIAVRASLIHNHFLKKKGLDGKYRLIRSGDKIKFCKMLTPNFFNSENVFAVLNEVPHELDVESFIDYDTQFFDVFLSPLEDMMQHVGWKIEDEWTVEDLI